MDVFEGAQVWCQRVSRTEHLRWDARPFDSHHRRPGENVAGCFWGKHKKSRGRARSTRGDPRSSRTRGARGTAFIQNQAGRRTLVEEVDARRVPCDALDRGAVERRRRPGGREVERRPRSSRRSPRVVRGDDEEDVLVGRRRRGGGRRRGVLRGVFHGDEREERRRGREGGRSDSRGESRAARPFMAQRERRPRKTAIRRRCAERRGGDARSAAASPSSRVAVRVRRLGRVDARAGRSPRRRVRRKEEEDFCMIRLSPTFPNISKRAVAAFVRPLTHFLAPTPCMAKIFSKSLGLVSTSGTPFGPRARADEVQPVHLQSSCGIRYSPTVETPRAREPCDPDTRRA